MKSHFRRIVGKHRRSALRVKVCVVATVLLFLTASHGGAAPPSSVTDAKFKGALIGILAVYDTKGETTALQRAILSRVHLRKLGGEQDFPLILTPKAGLSAAGMSRAWFVTRGITVETASKSWLRVIVPLRLMRVLAEDQEIAQIELPLRPLPDDCTYGRGSFISEGVYRTDADSFQAHNFTGSGIKIAVVDGGFINIDSAIAHGELPASTVKIELPGNGGNPISTVTNHGTGVSETVMDMAPGATLYCVQVTDQVDMENARDTLKAHGIRIANHSLAWFNGSYYNDSGPITTIVNSSHDIDSVFWTVAAGNEALSHWRGPWPDSADKTLKFSSVDSFLKFTDPYNSNSVSLFLNWNRYSSTPASATYLNLYLYNNNGILVD